MHVLIINMYLSEQRVAGAKAAVISRRFYGVAGLVCRTAQVALGHRDSVRLMWNPKLSARPSVHECPSCHQPQTKIQRKIGENPVGAVCFVCARPDCSLGLNLTKVDTWVAV